jgi:heterotetrameric sarcosine oxidase gamma subunit
VSFEFLMPDAAAPDAGFTPVARTSMEATARAAGARFEIRDGWNLAVGYTTPEREAQACAHAAGWADVSHLGKLEIQASPQDMGAIVAAGAEGAQLELGTATRAAGAWWLPLTGARTLVVCAPGLLGALRERLIDAAGSTSGTVSIVDVTTVFAAMTLVGPLAREVFARFCAADLRPAVTPVRALRPGSIARQPGILIREDEDRFLFLFGWAVGEYMWTVVQDAGAHLGGAPIGLDALAALAQPAEELGSHA